ncbi:MAG TPA: hypothetical protein VFP84_09665, partial [Kofleriaceae bacterium]|nr:hypothetical protein [Kofleriaceae bacterium]
DFRAALAYLQRHPRAPRTWARFLADWPGALARRAGVELDLATCDAFGLVATDVAYATFVRNAMRSGGMAAPWTRLGVGGSPRDAWRHNAREVGWWARWLANDCRDRAAWFAAQPAPPDAWAAVVADVRARRAARLWDRLDAGADRMIVATVALGEPPPPWLADHPPRAKIEFDAERADDVDRWTWWLRAAFDDAASWRAYVARWEAPAVWRAALGGEPYTSWYGGLPKH